MNESLGEYEARYFKEFVIDCIEDDDFHVSRVLTTYRRQTSLESGVRITQHVHHQWSILSIFKVINMIQNFIQILKRLREVYDFSRSGKRIDSRI